MNERNPITDAEAKELEDNCRRWIEGITHRSATDVELALAKANRALLADRAVTMETLEGLLSLPEVSCLSGYEAPDDKCMDCVVCVAHRIIAAVKGGE